MAQVVSCKSTSMFSLSLSLPSQLFFFPEKFNVGHLPALAGVACSGVAGVLHPLKTPLSRQLQAGSCLFPRPLQAAWNLPQQHSGTGFLLLQPSPPGPGSPANQWCASQTFRTTAEKISGISFDDNKTPPATPPATAPRRGPHDTPTAAPRRPPTRPLPQQLPPQLAHLALPPPPHTPWPCRAGTQRSAVPASSVRAVLLPRSAPPAPSSSNNAPPGGTTRPRPSPPAPRSPPSSTRSAN